MKLVIYIILLSGFLFPQEIQNVDFTVKSNGAIVVSYFLDDVSPKTMYKIWLEVSTDGGFTFDIKPQKVKGDVGNGIQGNGPKKILWEVLKERNVLCADDLVIKVKGRQLTSIKSIFRSLFVGNRFTKKRADGMSIYIGTRASSILNHSFNQFIAEHASPQTTFLNCGIKLVQIPFSFDLNCFADDYRLHKQWVEDNTDYLSFVNDASDISLYHEGINFAVNYAILPIFVIFYPTIGIGYEAARFRIGEAPPEDETTYTYSAVSNSGLFTQMSLNVTLLKKYHVETLFKYVKGKTAGNVVAQMHLSYHITGQ